VSPHGAVIGPMAEVVGRSLQHLSENDVGAMAAYLKSLPVEPGAERQPASAPPEDVMKLGAALRQALRRLPRQGRPRRRRRGRRAGLSAAGRQPHADRWRNR
jgi:hypothetical protein